MPDFKRGYDDYLAGRAPWASTILGPPGQAYDRGAAAAMLEQRQANKPETPEVPVSCSDAASDEGRLALNGEPIMSQTLQALSPAAATALAACYARRGAHKGQLLARCPTMGTLACAAWQGAMLAVNPYRASIGSLMLMSPEQKSIAHEVTTFFEALPRDQQIAAERNRSALEALGVW